MAAKVDSQEIFSNLSSKISQLLFGRTAGDRNILTKALDELNSINYRYTVVTSPTKAVLLLNQCCSFIPADDSTLVQKCSKLFTNLINRQNIVVEGRTLMVCIQWCLASLKTDRKDVIVDVLQALDALLRSNTHNINLLIDNVLKHIILLLREFDNPEVTLLGLQCLEACTAPPKDIKLQTRDDLNASFEYCANTLLIYLQKRPTDIDQLIYSKILITCLNGLQNVIVQQPEYLKKELGVILGVIKSYMLYGVKGVAFLEPQKLMASNFSIPETSTNMLREKKGGKLTRQRKHRISGVNKKDTRVSAEWEVDNSGNGYVPATIKLDYSSDSSPVVNPTNRLKTSDSDFSDSEGGKLAKLSVTQGRVRQAALSAFYYVVKDTEKRTMFSYWSSFIPDVALSTKHNLLTCILKDPSPRGRMAGLNVLLLLLTSSKLYLSQAETSDRNTAFTPFSVVLGLTLKELHKGLCLALNEVSVPVLTQVLKCFAALVQATPYHRLSPGIISKVVRNVKSFVFHKDATVQVTALIVLGCLLASEPVVTETKQVMLKMREESNNSAAVGLNDSQLSEHLDNIEFAEFSSDDEDNFENGHNNQIPWLLKRCLSNLGTRFEDNSELDTSTVVPAPIKLESLQVISAMSRNYFSVLMAPFLTYIILGLNISLSDKYSDLRLHAGRAVDFIGQAITRYLSSEESEGRVPIGQFIQFWQVLLSKSLTDLLQCEQHSILRAVGCDCLGSIGPQIFERLPRDKQILCVTLLFNCTRDEENSVKGAAVRALAICVLYPSLREDPGFVVDTAEAVYRTLQDENLMVRVKASWSLGNLSDALVLNSKSKSDPESEDLPDSLLLKLLTASVNGSKDNDKIKMNSVRALGNLLQLITEELIDDPRFKEITDQGINALVGNCTAGSNMKVRWNACYAIANALKNPALYCDQLNSSTPVNKQLSNNWRATVFNALMELVINFRNFKVRINAAVALSSPSSRKHYGPFYTSVWTSLLKALENSQNVEDFTEYKHRDHLVEQICLALGHLTSLMTEEDLVSLNETLLLYTDLLKNHVQRVLERVVPEKTSSLFSASVSLTHLEQVSGLNSGQRELVNKLKNIFLSEF